MNELFKEFALQYTYIHFVPYFVKVNDFEIQSTPVTQLQWLNIMENNPSRFKNNLLNPVETVSWEDCKQFIYKLNKLQTEYTYRLPLEKEWQLACTNEMDNSIDKYAIYNINSTRSVGSKLANKYGLYDMLGNVWELCEDLYDNTGSGRVFRGGSWYNDARYLRSAFRGYAGPGGRYDILGLRLVRTKR